jgi:hypothetical protein
MWHESVAFSVSQSCPPRRATRSVVLSHKISTPPACWPGESKFSSGQLSTQSSAKNTVESRNARCWCASCSQGKKSDKVQFRFDCLQHGSRLPKKSLGTMKKKDISVTKTIGGCIGEIQRWTAAQKKDRLEVRGPLVPYPAPEPAAFAPSKTALAPFLSPFRLFLCFVPIESKAKQKWLPTLPTWRKGTNFVSFPGLWIGFSQRYDIIKRKEWSFGYRRTLPKATPSSFRLFPRLK